MELFSRLKKHHYPYFLVAFVLGVQSMRFVLQGTGAWFLFPNFLGPLTEEAAKMFFAYTLLLLWSEYRNSYDAKLSHLEFVVLLVGFGFGIYEAYATYFGEHIVHTLIRSISHPLYAYLGYISFSSQKTKEKGIIAWIAIATIAHSVFNSLSVTTLYYQTTWIAILTLITLLSRYYLPKRADNVFKLPYLKKE